MNNSFGKPPPADELCQGVKYRLGLFIRWRCSWSWIPDAIQRPGVTSADLRRRADIPPAPVYHPVSLRLSIMRATPLLDIKHTSFHNSLLFVNNVSLMPEVELALTPDTVVERRSVALKGMGCQCY